MATRTGKDVLQNPRFWRAVTGVTLSAANIAVNTLLADKLAASTEGKTILEYWNTINLLYGISDIGFNLAQYQQARQAAKARLSEESSDLNNNFDSVADEFEKRIGGSGNGSVGTVRFVAKSGQELADYLSKLTQKPAGKTYTGDLYRSLSKVSEIDYHAAPKNITPYDEYSTWGRYDLDGEENAMYLSETVIGNQTELSAYGDWTTFNTYKFENITADNLIDLSDDAVRQQLGTQFDDLVKTQGTKSANYDIPNTIATWARKNGFNGIIEAGR